MSLCIVSKTAIIETSYNDGRVERKTWNAAKFRASSSVFGNLRSRPEYRSGNWQSRNIEKVHVKVKKTPNKSIKGDAKKPQRLIPNVGAEENLWDYLMV